MPLLLVLALLIAPTLIGCAADKRTNLFIPREENQAPYKAVEKEAAKTNHPKLREARYYKVAACGYSSDNPNNASVDCITSFEVYPDDPNRVCIVAITTDTSGGRAEVTSLNLEALQCKHEKHRAGPGSKND